MAPKRLIQCQLSCQHEIDFNSKDQNEEETGIGDEEDMDETSIDDVIQNQGNVHSKATKRGNF